MTKLLRKLFGRRQRLTPHQRGAQTRKANRSRKTWQHIAEMRASMTGEAA